MASKDRPFVSIIVPTRNRDALLRDCVESLLNQTYPIAHYEVIVVDDGSSEATARVMESLAGGHPTRVRYVKSPHKGPSAGRNIGIGLARGDLLAFVDDDVEAPPQWLDSVVSGATRHPEADLLAGRLLLRLEGRAPRRCGREPLGESELDVGESERPVDPNRVPAANMAVRREAVDKAGGFNEGLPVYGEETEWIHRVTAGGPPVIYLPDAYVWHRRTQADLKLSRLLRSRFNQGRGWPRIAPYIERHVSFFEGIWRALKAIRHAVARWCWVGLIEAAFWSGYAVQCGSMLMRGPKSPYISWGPRRVGLRARRRFLERGAHRRRKPPNS